MIMPVAVNRPTAKLTELEQHLVKLGFKSDDRKRFDEECKRDTTQSKHKTPPRFAYQSGPVRFITESRDSPFWTVQRKSGSSVLWFVDFPLDIGLVIVLKFIQMV
jgi:hypothetical protein